MIYCVEDEGAIRDLTVYTLRASGFEAMGFENSTGLWEAIKKQRPELIILDVMLPGEDGLEILKKLRCSSSTEDIPVIMATARDSEYDAVLGLDSGADDYLTKPFGMMEMISRIKAVLRRTNPKMNKPISYGEIVLDDSKHIVKVKGTPVSLTVKEYDLLRLFIDKPAHVFTRETLLSEIWGTDFIGESRTVDVHIGKLRTKLMEKGNIIQTVRGVGYKMEDINEQ